MNIREYRQNDLAELRAIHAAQGFAYPLPDLTDPLVMTRLVLRQGDAHDPAASCNLSGAGSNLAEADNRPEQGRIVGAALLRLTAEAYLLLDPHAGTPRDRWKWLLALHAATEREAWRRGLEDVHAWLPPSIATKFGRRVQQLGWVRDDAWTPYCKKLHAVETK